MESHEGPKLAVVQCQQSGEGDRRKNENISTMVITGTRKGKALAEHDLNAGRKVVSCSHRRSVASLPHTHQTHFAGDVSDEAAVVAMSDSLKSNSSAATRPSTTLTSHQ
jgi:hypothetical protein